MKKNALLLTLAVLFILISNLYSQQITIGAKGGFSIPNLTTKSSDPLSVGYSSRYGADGGIYWEYHVTKPFSIAVELQYSSQGGQKSGLQAETIPAQFAAMFPANAYLYSKFKSEAKLDYLLVPILAKYTWKINKRSPFRIYAAVGPFAGYLLSAHQVISGGTSTIYTDNQGKTPLTFYGQTITQPNDTTVNIKNQLNTFNVGIDGYVGISYAIDKNQRIFIEGGGNYGFLTIQKSTGIGKNNTGAGVLSVGYAYTFPGKHKYTRSR